MILTEEQLNVLNHVVVDGQAWADQAEKTFGEDKAKEAMLAKVARHKPSYDEVVKNDGYQTRKQRDDAEAKAEQDAYDNAPYSVKRKREYSKLNQYEMMFDDKRDGTTIWVDKINEIKAKYPKG